MKFKIIPIVLTAALTSIFTLFIAAKYQDQIPFIQKEERLPVNYAGFSTADKINSAPPADFEQAAEASVQAAVHIKTQIKGRTVTARDPNFNDDFFGELFGQRQYYIPPQVGSGSGVVISPDGYIITNYHVVSNADQVTVTFNDRYTTLAEVVGKDASTDIAVLKVKEKNLPYMEFGNSDEVKLGQWVLAVGYPLTLDATVTAGIVSAKSRAIGINRTQSASAIESFIQTDAAVNAGNSGGALVNTNGQLIGINSAIATLTGSYAGYSYAIPSNIVKKVVNDLMKFGSVQRAYLGVELLRGNRDQAISTERNDGVYVAGAPVTGSAYQAGIRTGDYLTQINNIAIHTEPQLLEQIARYKPGDNISVIYTRDGEVFKTTVQLKNIKGNTSIVKAQSGTMLLGAEMRALNTDEKIKYSIENGVLVTNITNGIISKQTTMRKGFIITSINDKPVNSADEIQQILVKNSNAKVAGFYPGNRSMYYYGLSANDSDNTE